MRNKRIIVAILAVLAVVIAPNTSIAQSSQTGQTPQPAGGVATVISVDQPDNCLRIRSGPGNSYDVIGCATLGEQLSITGVWTSNNWAQLADNGWVYGDQIQTDLRPPTAAFSQSQSYAVVENEYPVYYEYPNYYLPSYGYSTYYYGSVPIYVYGINVWRKHNPWWRHRHEGRHHHTWDRNKVFKHGVTPGRWDRNRNFRHDVATGTWNRDRGFGQDVSSGTARNFVNNRARHRSSVVTNRPNVSTSNAARFNADRFRSGSSNVIGSGRVFSNPNTLRSSSSPNVVRNFSRPNTNRNSSTPNTLRSFSVLNTARSFSRPNNARSFSVPNTARSFSAPNTTRTGSIGARNFSSAPVGGFNSAARSGGGARTGGGTQLHVGGARRR